MKWIETYPSGNEFQSPFYDLEGITVSTESYLPIVREPWVMKFSDMQVDLSMIF
jgi:hypothetical protein